VSSFDSFDAVENLSEHLLLLLIFMRTIQNTSYQFGDRDPLLVSLRFQPGGQAHRDHQGKPLHLHGAHLVRSRHKVKDDLVLLDVRETVWLGLNVTADYNPALWTRRLSHRAEAEVRVPPAGHAPVAVRGAADGRVVAPTAAPQDAVLSFRRDLLHLRYWA
jgi:hypothetical protein